MWKKRNKIRIDKPENSFSENLVLVKAYSKSKREETAKRKANKIKIEIK